MGKKKDPHIILDYKPRLGDRWDGQKLRNLDGMHLIMPLMWPGRTNAEAFISERIDLTNMNAYIEKRNAENPDFKYNMFQIIVATTLKTILLRPKMNRFIAGGNTYQRNHLSASFIVKKQFSDHGEEALAKLYGHPDDTLETIHQYFYETVTSCRSDKLDASSDALNFFTKVPGPITKAFVALMRGFDRHGWIPRGLIETDPYYSSVILTNLGSIKLHSGYHHLTNWGTASVFVIVGEKKPRPFYNEDGTFEMRDSIDLGLTVDERIGDGYYFSKTVRLMKKLLEHPELLEQPLGTEIEY